MKYSWPSIWGSNVLHTVYPRRFWLAAGCESCLCLFRSESEIFAWAKSARRTVTFFISGDRGGNKLRLGSTMFRRVTSRGNFLSVKFPRDSESFFFSIGRSSERETAGERERERKGGGENKVNRSMAKKIGDRSISSDYWPRKGNDRVCSWQIEDRIDVRSFVRCSLVLSIERQLKGRVTRVCLLSMKVKNRQIRLWNECLSVKILTTWCVFRDVFLSAMFKLTIVRCIPTLETFIGVAANVIASAFNQIVKFDEGFFFESMDCLVFIR